MAEAAIRAVPALLDNDVTVTARGLTPVLVVRYLRSRYRDPLSDARLCLDRRIQVSRVSAARLAWRGPITLPATVLEIKSSALEPPARLTFLRALGAEATSYSKYHACFEAVVSSTAFEA